MIDDVRRSIGAIAIVALLAGGLPATVLATDDFFAGRTISYIVATKPGGGYDKYGRLVAKYMEKHLPGSTVVVRNVPGAGHLIGTNQLFASAPDGLTIGTFNTGMVYAQLMALEGVQFDLRRMSWIGKAASDSRVLVIGVESGIESIEALQRAERQILLASGGYGSAAHIESLLLSRALGLPTTLVQGFSGNEAEMSVMRGEIDGMIGAFSSMRPFVENGHATYLLAIGDGGAPSVPNVRDLVDDADGRAMVRLIETQSELGRLTAGPPDMPLARLQRLRTAYRDALNDPDLRADAVQLGIPIVPLFGEEVARRIDLALDQPAITRDLLLSLKSE